MTWKKQRVTPFKSNSWVILKAVTNSWKVPHVHLYFSRSTQYHNSLSQGKAVSDLTMQLHLIQECVGES